MDPPCTRSTRNLRRWTGRRQASPSLPLEMRRATPLRHLVRNPRVTVLGGTGFIGRRVVRRLEDAGAHVSAVQRGRAARRRPLASLAAVSADLAALRAALAEAAAAVLVDMIAYTAEDAERLVRSLPGSLERLIVISSGDVYWTYGAFLGYEPAGPASRRWTRGAPLRRLRYPLSRRGVGPRGHALAVREDGGRRARQGRRPVPVTFSGSRWSTGRTTLRGASRVQLFLRSASTINHYQPPNIQALDKQLTRRTQQFQNHSTPSSSPFRLRTPYPSRSTVTRSRRAARLAGARPSPARLRPPSTAAVPANVVGWRRRPLEEQGPDEPCRPPTASQTKRESR